MRETITVEEISGNIFADIGLPKPEVRLAKADLAIRIFRSCSRPATHSNSRRPHLEDRSTQNFAPFAWSAFRLLYRTAHILLNFTSRSPLAISHPQHFLDEVNNFDVFPMLFQILSNEPPVAVVGFFFTAKKTTFSDGVTGDIRFDPA